MYVDESTVAQKGKLYTRYLLRKSYREGGKVRHRTIANLSRCSSHEIEAIRLALHHKRDPSGSADPSKVISLRQGMSVGAVWLISHVARKLGIADALGKTRRGKLALSQIIARVIEWGSPLSALNLSNRHAVLELLGLAPLEVSDLKSNLEWIGKKKTGLEKHLVKKLHPAGVSRLFLYDITGSCLHSGEEETAPFGLKKHDNKGRRTVIVLCCDISGKPLSVEMFSGGSPEAFASQIRSAAARLGGEVTLVWGGDREQDWHVDGPRIYGMDYILTVSGPQTEKLFGQEVTREINPAGFPADIEKDGIRYLFLRGVPPGGPQMTGRAAIGFVERIGRGESKSLPILKTGLLDADREVLRDRFTDVGTIESVFYSVLERERDVRERQGALLQGHLFISAMAYLIIRELALKWSGLGSSVEEGINELSTLSVVEVLFKGAGSCSLIPRPHHLLEGLLDAAGVPVPLNVLLKK